MTGRERTLKALDHQPVDRYPVAGGMVQNAQILARCAGVADFWEAPRSTLFEAFRRLGCDVILGPVMPKTPASTTVDASGRPTDFTWVDPAPELTTPEQVARWAVSVPSPEEVRASFDHEKAIAEYLALFDEGARECPDMLLIPHCLGYAPAFPTSDGHFTYEAFLMACRLHTAELAHLFRHWGEQARLRYEAVAEATRRYDLLPLIWTGQDLCDAKGPVMSPDLLEALYFPVLERAFEPLKEAGIRIVWHTDANYRRILPRMIELGIDGFQGFYESEGGIRIEDLARMRMRSGQPPILFGSISTVWVLPEGSVGDVEREVDRCVEAARAGGAALILAPSSSIGPEVPEENVRAFFRHAVSL